MKNASFQFIKGYSLTNILKKQLTIQNLLTKKFQICTVIKVNIMILKLLIYIPIPATSPLKNVILLTMWNPKLSEKLSHVQNIWKLTRSLKQMKGPKNRLKMGQGIR